MWEKEWCGMRTIAEVVEDIKKDNESQIAEVNNENIDYWNKVSQENKDNE